MTKTSLEDPVISTFLDDIKIISPKESGIVNGATQYQITRLNRRKNAQHTQKKLIIYNITGPEELV